MIIGIDATRANKPHKTGVEWYSYHVIREMVKIPSPHTFRLYFWSEPEPGLQNLGPNVQYCILSWPLPYLWTQLRLSWEMLLNPPDVLFIPAQIIPVIHPVRTVTTVHDVAYRPYPESYRWRSRMYLELAARWAAKLPGILTVSEFSKQEIVKYYQVPANKITVTPLGFTVPESQTSATVLTKHDIRQPYLAYIGRLERKKNVRFLVESFNLMKQESWAHHLQLVLIGVKSYGWDEIERVITASEFSRDIKVLGYVPEEEKHSLLVHASAFVLLSAYEGFGIPLLEAMAAGTPVVCSDQASLPEVAGNAALLVPRGNAGAVADAVRRILVNQPAREKLIQAGHARAQQFTWSATARLTLGTLESVYNTAR